MDPAVFQAFRSRLAALANCLAEGPDMFDRYLVTSWKCGGWFQRSPYSRKSGRRRDRSTTRLWWTFSARTRPRYQPCSTRHSSLLLPPQFLLLCCRPHSPPPCSSLLPPLCSSLLPPLCSSLLPPSCTSLLPRNDQAYCCRPAPDCCRRPDQACSSHDQACSSHDQACSSHDQACSSHDPACSSHDPACSGVQSPSLPP